MVILSTLLDLLYQSKRGIFWILCAFVRFSSRDLSCNLSSDLEHICSDTGRPAGRVTPPFPGISVPYRCFWVNRDLVGSFSTEVGLPLSWILGTGLAALSGCELTLSSAETGPGL